MLVWVISIPVYRVILDYYEVNVMKMIRSLGFGDMIDKLLGNLVDKLVDKSVDKLELESTLRVINDLDTYGVLSSNMFEMLISSGVLFFMINAFSRLCVRLLYVLLYIRYNFVNIGNCSVFTIHFFGLYCINFVKLCILSILLLSMLFVFANTLYEEVILLLGMFLYGFYRYFVQVAFSMWLFNDFWKFTKNTSFMTLLFYVDTELDQLSVRFARKYLM